MVGYPHRALFSIQFAGLNSQGLPTFVNEDGTITVDQTNLQSYVHDYLKYEGPTEPTTTGSLGNNFKYKNWGLNVFITYSYGNVVRLNSNFYSAYNDYSAMSNEMKNRWVTYGDEQYTTVPVIADSRLYTQYTRLAYAYYAYNLSSDRVAKGDFIRMKEISLTYDFPKAWIKHLKLNSLNCKLQGTNLFLIYSDSKLGGQDPEFYNSGRCGHAYGTTVYLHCESRLLKGRSI